VLPVPALAPALALAVPLALGLVAPGLGPGRRHEPRLGRRGAADGQRRHDRDWHGRGRDGHVGLDPASLALRLPLLLLHEQREVEPGRLVAGVDALLPLAAVLLLQLHVDGEALRLPLRQLGDQDAVLGVKADGVLHEVDDLRDGLLAKGPGAELLPVVPAVVEEEVVLVDPQAVWVLDVPPEGGLQEVQLEAQAQQRPVLEGEVAEEWLAVAHITHVLNGEKVDVHLLHLLLFPVLLLVVAIVPCCL